MKTISIKAILILTGLMLVCNRISAEVGSKIRNFIGNEYAQFQVQGLYVIGGIVVAGLLSYVVINHFTKDESVERIHKSSSHVNHHRRNHHKVIKKTA